MATPQQGVPSHPGSPVVQSPVPLLGGGGGAAPATPYALSVVQPLTPQHGVFALPAGTPANFDPSVLAAQAQQMLSSKVLQNPMSKLAYLGSGSSPELLQFPNLSSQEGGVAVSQVKVELMERELGALWLRHNEHLANQVSLDSRQS